MCEIRQVSKNCQLPQLLTEYIFYVSKWWYSWKKKNDCKVCVYYNLNCLCSHIRKPNHYIRMPGKIRRSTSFPRTSSLASAAHVSRGTCKTIMLLTTTRIGVVDHRIEVVLTHLSASECGCATLSRVHQNVFTLTIAFLQIRQTGDFLASKASGTTLEPVQWVSGLLFRRLSGSGVRYRQWNEWRYSLLPPPYTFMACEAFTLFWRLHSCYV